MRVLPLLVLLLALAPGEEPAFQGVIDVDETLASLSDTTADRAELDKMAVTVEERLRQARTQLLTAPPVVARSLTEDIAVWQAELEHIVLGRGGALTLGRTSYLISRGRILMRSALAVVLIDRNRGTAMASVDGVVRTLTLAPIPAVDQAGGVPGGDWNGRQSTLFARKVGNKEYRIAVVPGLPNPFAFSLIQGGAERSVSEAELSAVLASMPGLPVAVETRDGELARRLVVVRYQPQDIPEETFRPWQ